MTYVIVKEVCVEAGLFGERWDLDSYDVLAVVNLPPSTIPAGEHAERVRRRYAAMPEHQAEKNYESVVVRAVLADAVD